MYVEIDGIDVTSGGGGVPRAGVTVSTEVGQRSSGTIRLVYPPGRVFRINDSVLQLPSGQALLLPDGSALDIGGGAQEDVPPFWADVVVDHPERCYRASVADSDPWLCWRLDDGGTTRARDASGNGRHGTYSASGLGLRALEPPDTRVPYGASLRVDAGSVTGPSVADLAAPYTVLFLLRIDAGADGVSEVFRVGPAVMRRSRISSSVQRLAWSVGVASVQQDVMPGEWLHVAAVREAGAIRLSVEGADERIAAAATWATSQHAGQTCSIHGSGTDLESDIDEVAILPVALTAAEIADLRGRVDHDRVFGGLAYEPADDEDPGGGRVVTVKAVGYWALLDHLHVEGIWASATDQPVNEVIRDILTAAEYPHSADGVDKTNPIGRVVGRAAAASDLVRKAMDRSATLAWGDSWGDVHLDNAGELRRLPVVLDRTNTAPKWKRKTLATRWRTRTIVVGAGVPGALIADEFTGDGAQTTFDLSQQVREIRDFQIDGVSVAAGELASGWLLGPEKFTLVSATAPVSGTRIRIDYVSESPLVAVASDPEGVRTYGRIERKVEDTSLDTAAAVQERATTDQTAHGRPGLEIAARVKPARRPLFHGVGGAPIFRFGSVDQRMLVERVQTSWLAAGRYVAQKVTLRANDYTSDLQAFTDRRGNVLPPAVSVPPAPPVVDIAVEGLALPVNMGGDYEAYIADSSWVRVPGAVLPILDGRILSEIDLTCTFMASVDGTGNQAGRFRIWDRTRNVRIGDEQPVTGQGETLYQLRDLRLAPQLSQLEPQIRRVDAAAMRCWGISLRAA